MPDNAHIASLKTQITNLLTPYANEMPDPRLGEFLTLSLGRVLINKHKATTQNVEISSNELRHITDWIKAAIVNEASWLSNVDADQRPKKLMKFSSVEGMMQEADKSMLKAAQRLSGIKIAEGDEELVTELKDGYYIVKLLTPSALDYESSIMQHCIGDGGYDDVLQNVAVDLFSLRDPSGKPHVTLEIDEGSIMQIQGKQNKPPIKEYMDLLLPFLNEKRYLTTLINPHEFGCMLDKDKTWFHCQSFTENQIFDGNINFVQVEYIPSFPNKFHVTGHLFLDSSSVKKLPDDLTIGKNLDISYTKIPKLPKGLVVGTDLDLDEGNITKLPADLHVGNKLSWHNAVVNEIPNSVYIGGFIDLTGAEIRKFPENFHVKKDLDISYANIKFNIKGLTVDGNFNIKETRVNKGLSDIKVKGNFICTYAQMEALPDNLDVNGYVDATSSYITSLGNNLHFKNDLILSRSSIMDLPDNLVVNGTLNVDDTDIVELPRNLRVRDNLNIMNTEISALPSDIIVGKVICIRNNQITLEGIPDDIDMSIMIANKGKKSMSLADYKNMLVAEKTLATKFNSL